MSKKKSSDEFESLGEEVLGEIDEDEIEEIVSDEVDEALEANGESQPEPEEEMEIDIPLSERDDLSPEEAEELREQEIQRMMQVLSRGIVNEQLARVLEESCPKGCRGKFVRDDFGSITRYQNLGYTFTYREGAVGTHGTGDERIRVGDVVLMTITEDKYEVLQEVRRRQIENKLGAGRRDYHRRVAEAQSQGQTVPQTFDEGEVVIRRETVS